MPWLPDVARDLLQAAVRLLVVNALVIVGADSLRNILRRRGGGDGEDLGDCVEEPGEGGAAAGMRGGRVVCALDDAQPDLPIGCFGGCYMPGAVGSRADVLPARDIFAGCYVGESGGSLSRQGGVGRTGGCKRTYPLPPILARQLLLPPMSHITIRREGLEVGQAKSCLTLKHRTKRLTGYQRSSLLIQRSCANQWLKTWQASLKDISANSDNLQRLPEIFRTSTFLTH